MSTWGMVGLIVYVVGVFVMFLYATRTLRHEQCDRVDSIVFGTLFAVAWPVVPFMLFSDSIGPLITRIVDATLFRGCRR